MRKYISLFLILLISASPLSFAQEGSSQEENTNVQSSSQSNSGAVSASNFYGGDNFSTTSRQFVVGLPYYSSTIPGNPGGLSQRKQDLTFSYVSIAWVDSVLSSWGSSLGSVGSALKVWDWFDSNDDSEDRIKSVSYYKIKDEAKAKDGINILQWDVEKDRYPTDKELGMVTVRGLPWHPDRLFQAEGVKACREKVDKGTGEKTKRVAWYKTVHYAPTTKNSGTGVGMFGSWVRGSGSNDASAGPGLGAFNARQTNFIEEFVSYDVYCFNDGPVVPPPSYLKKLEEEAERERQERERLAALENSKLEQGSRLMEVLIEQQKTTNFLMQKFLEQEKSSTSAPAVEPEEVSVADVCAGIPDLTVYFGLESWVIKPEYFPAIEETAEWLKSNPVCEERAQSQGHTCKLGSESYNNNLASKRGKALRDKLTEYGAHIREFASLGEYRTKSRSGNESIDKDRRAFVQILGPASGD